MTDSPPPTPLETLTVFRADHPIAGERTRYTALGWPPGHSVRRQQLIWAVLTAMILSGLVLDLAGLNLFVAAAAGIIGTALLVALITIVVMRVRGGATTVAIVLTTERLITARSDAGHEATPDEDTTSEISWVSLEPIRSRWLRGQPTKVLTLGGPAGPVVSIEMGNMDERSFEATLVESALERSSAH